MSKRKFWKKNLVEIINYQFALNNYEVTFEDIEKDYKWSNEWLYKYTTTKEKEEEFNTWLIEYLKPYISKARLKQEAWWILLDYGFSYAKENEVAP